MTQILRQQNLKVSFQYINWILQTNRGIMGHLYSCQSLAGAYDYFTDLDADINYDGQVWKSGSLRFEGLKRKVAIGTSVDEQTLKIWAAPTDTLWGSNFLEGVQQGLLAGGSIVRYRIIWRFVSGNAASDIQLAPLAVWPMFTGYFSTVDKGGASHVELKVKSALMRLAVDMPRNYYQPGCLWTLFSSDCTLNKATYAVEATIAAGITTTTLPIAGGIANPVGADGIDNYAQGRIMFTSGVNEGFLTLLDDNDSANLYLAYPLNDLPSVGDTIVFYPGCSKAYSTCSLKYNNTANFRGYDKVPPIMVSV